MRRPGCEARQYSDQMHCQRCGLTWDMNDPDEPSCRPDTDFQNEHIKGQRTATEAERHAFVEETKRKRFF